MTAAESRASFFRQSGWMVIATVGGGVFMTAVHTVAAKMGRVEYGMFATLLKFLILLNIPAVALQTVFAQQTAAAHDERLGRELTGTFRGVMAGLFLFWLVCLGGVVMFKDELMQALKITSAAALWMTMVLVLTSLWVPVFKGLLQGSQHFLGLGWVAIMDGLGRLLAVGVIVLLLKGRTTGAVFGAVIGQCVAILAGAWWTRSLWSGHSAMPDWRPWLGRVIPLTLGSGAVMGLLTIDVIYVRSVYSEEESPFYIAPSFIGFALLQFTMPVAMVMFSKVVHSRARAQETEAMKLSLLATAAMGGLAALAATLLPKLPLQILYFTKREFWDMWPLVPWFAWCMLALTLANVLISNLLAHEKFAIVPWLVALAGAFTATLFLLTKHFLALEMHAAFRQIVQILTGFNLLAFGLALWFTWGRAEKPAVAASNQATGVGG